MIHDTRFSQLTTWVHSLNGWEHAVISVASSDAGFRRYFRATLPNKTAIVMDAPPDKVTIQPFLDVTQRLMDADVNVPTILAQNRLDGFLLLEDFGSTLYLPTLNPATADQLYQDAMEALLKIQVADCNN